MIIQRANTDISNAESTMARHCGIKDEGIMKNEGEVEPNECEKIIKI